MSVNYDYYPENAIWEEEVYVLDEVESFGLIVILLFYDAIRKKIIFMMMFLIEINGRWCCWYHWVTILCVTAVVYWKVWLILGVGQFIRNFLVFLCFRGFFLSFSWHFDCVLFFIVWRDLSLLFRLVLILWGYWWDVTFSLFLHWCISFLSCFRSK